jgi:hypothetical protein
MTLRGDDVLHMPEIGIEMDLNDIYRNRSHSTPIEA